MKCGTLSKKVSGTGLRISLNYLVKSQKHLLGNSSRPGSHSPWALSSQMGTRHSSTGLARPAGRPAGRASSRNPPNLDPACDKPASAAPFSGISRGRPTCGTSGRSGGQLLGAFGEVRLGRSAKGQKKSKNESSQNEVFYSGKCSHTPGEPFGAIPDLPTPI